MAPPLNKTNRSWEAAKRRGSTLASHPAALVLFPAFLKFFRGKIINVSEVNQWRWLEESGQWLENVDQTHLVLASGKLVLQKELSFGK